MVSCDNVPGFFLRSSDARHFALHSRDPVRDGIDKLRRLLPNNRPPTRIQAATLKRNKKRRPDSGFCTPSTFSGVVTGFQCSACSFTGIKQRRRLRGTGSVRQIDNSSRCCCCKAAYRNYSNSLFQRRISPCPPRPPPKRYQRPLIVTLVICAHSEAAKQCDKWALPCLTACVGEMEISGVCVLSPPLFSPIYMDTRNQNNKYSTRRLAPVLWGQREVPVVLNRASNELPERQQHLAEE
ncbi:hypothetical protein PAMA_011379 [Pampus argenteus]